MPKKLYELTEAHRAQLKPWADKWIANALSTKQMDDDERRKTVEAINGLYEAANLPLPKHIVFVPNPLVLALAGPIAAGVGYLRHNPEFLKNMVATGAATRAATRAATVAATRAATRAATEDATWAATGAATRAATEDATRAATVAATWDATGAATGAATRAATRAATGAATGAATEVAKMNQFTRFLIGCIGNYYNMWDGGNQWSGWVSYLSFFRHVAKLKLPEYEKFQWYENAALYGGPRIMTPDFCMVSDRPLELHVNSRHQPHCENGPFCRWREGFELYYFNGVKMSKEWVMTPAEQIKPQDVLAVTNVEQRRELIRKIGVERMIEALPHTSMDKSGDYELLELELHKDVPRSRWLKMLNPSVGCWHVERVGRECDTVQAAINYRASKIIGKNEEWNPAVLT